MTVMVIGAHGQLGRAVTAIDDSIVAIARSGTASTADLRDRDSLRRVITLRPHHVILTAAYTNVAGCETDPDAWLVNVEGTQAVVEEAAAVGSTVTFISTDYVFDGAAGPYDEGAPTHPLNAYGRQKLAAEQVVLAVPGNLVVRTCQVFGPDPRRANFVLRVADQLHRGEPVRASGRMLGTPTYAPDLASALIRLTTGGATGIRHVVGDELLSRFDLARRVARASGADPDLITEVHVEDGVRRPLQSWMVSRYPVAMTPLDLALALVTR